MGLQVSRSVRAQTTTESDLRPHPEPIGRDLPRAGEAEGVSDSRRTPDANPEHLEVLLGALERGTIDFSAANYLWKTYLVDDYEDKFPGISDYLTPVNVRNSYATLDPATNVLRFTSNTRDVARYLGDL